MRDIYPQGARPPAGHYVPAVESNGLIFISGQLPIDMYTGEHTHGSIENQAKKTLENLRLILQSSGCQPADVVKISIYLSDVESWGCINQLCQEFFGDHRPARIVVPSGKLHFGFDIEIEAVAEKRP